MHRWFTHCRKPPGQDRLEGDDLALGTSIGDRAAARCRMTPMIKKSYFLFQDGKIDIPDHQSSIIHAAFAALK